LGLLGAGLLSGVGVAPPEPAVDSALAPEVLLEAPDVEDEDDPEPALVADAVDELAALAPGSGAKGLRDAPTLRCTDPLVVSATGWPVAVGAWVTVMLEAEAAVDNGETGAASGAGVEAELPPPSTA
jgi:hypothetical protein